MSVVLRETTLAISVSTGEHVSMESEKVRVVSLRRSELSEITRLNIRSLRSGYLKGLTKQADGIDQRSNCTFCAV